MELLDFLQSFCQTKGLKDEKKERTGENLYGLACGLKSLENGDFSVISKHIINDIFGNFPSKRWLEGLFEAIIIKNGNGDMVNAIKNVVREIQKIKPIIDLEVVMVYGFSRTKIITDYFEAFFRCYKALIENPEVCSDGTLIYRAIKIFIKHDKNCEKLGFFDEIFLNHIRKDDFIQNLAYLLDEDLEDNRTTVKYLVHLAERIGSEGKKKIMQYLTENEGKRKFIRVKGVRRVLRRIFGQEVTGLSILKLLSNGEIIALSQTQKDVFEKTCTLIGHFQHKVILEVDKKQYLFEMDKSQEWVLCSPIKKKFKPEETEVFFADGII